MTTVYTKEYLDKFEVKEKTFLDRKEALAFARKLRKEGWEAKTEKWSFPGMSDRWEVTAKRLREKVKK